jgi:hypothetical protein
MPGTSFKNINMNPRNQSRIVIITIALFSLVLSCKKDNTNNNSDNASTVQTQADDQTMVSDEADMMANDINAALSSQISINGQSATVIGTGMVGVNSVNTITHTQGTGQVTIDSLICDAKIVIDTSVNPRTITITYTGTNCWGNRTRTGTVVVSIAQGIHWEDKGAVVNVTVQNLVITRMSDKKSITFSGTRSFTNVSGGNLVDLANLGSITHTLTDNFTITFANNLARSWQTAKQRVYTFNNGIVLTTTGTHSDGNYNNIAEWGTNRFGTSFVSLITIPKVFRQDCDFRLVSGQNQILLSDSLNSTITYGLDQKGNPTGCPGSGNYYLEVVWSYLGIKTVPILFPY